MPTAKVADHHLVSVTRAHRGTPSECWRAECTRQCGWQTASLHREVVERLGAAHEAHPWPSRAEGQALVAAAQAAADLRREAALLLMVAHAIDPR